MPSSPLSVRSKHRHSERRQSPGSSFLSVRVLFLPDVCWGVVPVSLVGIFWDTLVLNEALILLALTPDSTNRAYAAIIEGVGIHLPDDASQPTKDLVLGILLRNISLDGIQRLIRLGADVNVIVTLTFPWEQNMNPAGNYTQLVSLLVLATDTKSVLSPLQFATLPAIASTITLPKWSTREMQAAILNELISAGANVNGGDDHTIVPIKMAKESLNMTAVEVLLSHHVAVRGHPSLASSPLLFMQGCSLTDEEAEDTLFDISARLLQHDPSLATDTGVMGDTTVISICSRRSMSQRFLNRYLDMLVQHGASLTQQQQAGGGASVEPLTPLQCAAWASNHKALTYLLGRIPLTDIDGPGSNAAGVVNLTVLSWAAQGLRCPLDVSRSRIFHRLRPVIREMINEAKRCIRTLLQHGASVDLMPSHTQETQYERSLVLEEYAAILNELPERVMAAINAALKPQRDTAARIGCLLPMAPHHDGAHPDPSPSNLTFGPCEATGIAWKIGSFLHDPSAARAVIDKFLIADSLLKRRVSAAVDHFINQAATKTASNREVVGGARHAQQQEGGATSGTGKGESTDCVMVRLLKSVPGVMVAGRRGQTAANREVVGKAERGKGERAGRGLQRWLKSVMGVTGAGQGGQTVCVPPLQCFAIKRGEDGQHRRLGVREVVHRASLDEAAVYGLEGSIIKCCNGHLGNTDCRFQWGQLGYIDQSGRFVSLGID
ncbi:unnamed protein product [Vitrella brassicaformis CCMP3155]|uniref:Uncharacterized protein n=1 Tax=Vitrella brassicaformis (strain CCMP3155) TaxID=1169540 RepID=A0A0G4F9R9_VITBC|nr:unnamed protein product [Vitrella brassicaformis CCMP3155]|eukprot:CEM09620.1 unnamed protein product [Vitrella brassicaformis CCMP3155]